MATDLVGFADTTCVTCNQNIPFTPGVGSLLKSTGTNDWEYPGALININTTQFSAMPGGCRKGNLGPYLYARFGGYWWTSTPVNAFKSFSRGLDHFNTGIYRYPSGKQDGFSVRCVKD
jgi:uncharacterized protein (TIGR02145 family)